MNACRHDGCDSTKRGGRGYCSMHYMRIYRHGSPDALHVRPKGLPPESHSCWTGEDATYEAVHNRIRKQKGRASDHLCECGKPAAQWAYDNADPDERIDLLRSSSRSRYSVDPDHYKPMCALCHRRMDSARRRQEKNA